MQKPLLEVQGRLESVAEGVEKLLAEAEGARGGATHRVGALEHHCQLLERLAGEVARLHYNTSRGQELPFVQALRPRVEAADAQLGSLLAEGLTASLHMQVPSARRHCLAAFAAAGNTASAEQVVRQVLVGPAVQEALQKAAASRPPGAAAGSEGLAAVLPPVLEAVLDRCKTILQATLAPRSGLSAFNVLGNSILAEMDEAVADALPSVYSPGVPATFHANFQAAMALLDALEAQCPTAAALHALRTCPAHASFMRRWKLSVYFSLRFQEIAGELEAALSAPSLNAVPAESSKSNILALQLLPSFQLQLCLSRAISQDVFLRPLSDRVVRLSLQLVARFTSWLQAGLEARAAAAQEDATQHSTTAGRPMQHHHPAEGPASSAPQAEAAERGGPHQWALEASVDHLARLRADVDEVAEWVQVDFAQSLVKLLALTPRQVQEAVERAVGDGAQALEEQGAPLSAALVAHLSVRCCDSLRQLKAIPTTYRMTSKPMPFRPSPYAGALLKPLHAFLDAPSSQTLRKSARSSVAQEVVGQVAAKFGSMAGELLEQLQKTETSLKRLKKARAPEAAPEAGAAGAQMSDIDKMARQLFLDVQELGRQAERVGVDPRTNPPYQALWKAVAPADQANISL
ncbi:hypothetical protein WJX73_008548 [Symbiochloris irregularis]|uniref:COG complex component COG2 C-terminal domain-containing protein n=1 Tax=Symbiochloris irregularis TaxID=706552 RepID=A0AAW1NQ25_9CHLO